jgi:SUMO ligase MMS21 Smc5/6 complex component
MIPTDSVFRLDSDLDIVFVQSRLLAQETNEKFRKADGYRGRGKHCVVRRYVRRMSTNEAAGEGYMRAVWLA